MKTYIYLAVIGCALSLRGVSQAGPSGPLPAGNPVNPAGALPHGVKNLVPAVNKTPAQNNPAAIRSQFQGVIQPASPLLTEARHHGPAPAVIGGPASAKNRNASAINGTTVNRKP